MYTSCEGQNQIIYLTILQYYNNSLPVTKNVEEDSVILVVTNSDNESFTVEVQI